MDVLSFKHFIYQSLSILKLASLLVMAERRSANKRAIGDVLHDLSIVTSQRQRVCDVNSITGKL